jgi:hypothetical protein
MVRFGRGQHRGSAGSRSYYWTVGWFREQRLQLKDWLYWRRVAKHEESAGARRR